MKGLLAYLKRYRKECFLAPLFKMLEASFELLVPLVISAIIDQGIGGGDGGFIIRMCLILIALGLIGLVCAITAQYFAAKAAVGVATGVRHSLFEHLQRLSFSNMDELGASTMITRMTSDVNQTQTGINMTLRLFLRSPFVVFGAMIMAFTIDFRSALIFAGVIALLSAVVFGIMAVNIPMMKSVQQALEKVLGATRENLSGARVIRAFCKEDSQFAEFVEKNRTLTTRQKRAGWVSGLMNPLTYLIINFAITYLIYTGAIQVDSGALTQGQVVALYNYMSQILVELIKLANLIVTITKAIACAGRIETVMLLKPSMTDVKAPKAAPASGDVCVQFNDVSTRYANAGDDSLTGISFTALRGQTIGVIGGTGSGKTTLVNLIPRFYDASAGSVQVNGVDVKEQSSEALRQKVAVVPQKAVLFKGTIRENLRWGKQDATDEEIWQALETAQAAEIVRGKEKGLDELIEQNGRNLSGGQRQRLTIARALVRQPEILILDDSASALDYATDAALRKALRKLPAETTTFIVSQRASSIRHADLILVLDDGELAGSGTHDELMESCPVYQEIYYSQYPKEAM